MHLAVYAVVLKSPFLCGLNLPLCAFYVYWIRHCMGVPDSPYLTYKLCNFSVCQSGVAVLIPLQWPQRINANLGLSEALLPYCLYPSNACIQPKTMCQPVTCMSNSESNVGAPCMCMFGVQSLSPCSSWKVWQKFTGHQPFVTSAREMMTDDFTACTNINFNHCIIYSHIYQWCIYLISVYTSVSLLKSLCWLKY